MRENYNQILLTTKDGRTVSIIQGDGIMGKKGNDCEIWIAGQAPFTLSAPGTRKNNNQPVGHLTVEDLTKYLVENVL